MEKSLKIKQKPQTNEKTKIPDQSFDSELYQTRQKQKQKQKLIMLGV